MNKKSQMELKYEKYLESTSKTMIIDSVTYYRAVNVETLSVRGKSTVCITIPHEYLKGETTLTLKNEYGYIFRKGNAVFVRFNGEIPEWYFRCVTFAFEGSDCPPEETGEYFTFAYEK